MLANAVPPLSPPPKCGCGTAAGDPPSSAQPPPVISCCLINRHGSVRLPAVPARRPARFWPLLRASDLAAKDRFRVAIALDGDLIEQADQYAASHGLTFSDVVADALRRLIKRKSA